MKPNVRFSPRTHARSPHNVHRAAPRWLGPSLHLQFSLTDCLFVRVLGRCGISALITSRIETDRKAVGRSGHSAVCSLLHASHFLSFVLLSCRCASGSIWMLLVIYDSVPKCFGRWMNNWPDSSFRSKCLWLDTRQLHICIWIAANPWRTWKMAARQKIEPTEKKVQMRLARLT